MGDRQQNPVRREDLTSERAWKNNPAGCVERLARIFSLEWRREILEVVASSVDFAVVILALQGVVPGISVDDRVNVRVPAYLGLGRTISLFNPPKDIVAAIASLLHIACSLTAIRRGWNRAVCVEYSAEILTDPPQWRGLPEDLREDHEGFMRQAESEKVSKRPKTFTSRYSSAPTVSSTVPEIEDLPPCAALINKRCSMQNSHPNNKERMFLARLLGTTIANADKFIVKHFVHDEDAHARDKHEKEIQEAVSWAALKNIMTPNCSTLTTDPKFRGICPFEGNPSPWRHANCFDDKERSINPRRYIVRRITEKSKGRQ